MKPKWDPKRYREDLEYRSQKKAGALRYLHFKRYGTLEPLKVHPEAGYRDIPL